MSNLILDWWGFAVFVATGIFGWLLGVERNRWKIENLKEEVDEIKKDIKLIEKSNREEQISIARVVVLMESIEEKIVKVEKSLSDKVDK